MAREDIRPSQVNDNVYRPPQPDDPDIVALAESIRGVGVLEPLTITRDRYILSGHRRYCASGVAGLTHVPVLVDDITSDDPEFLRRLVDANRQRVKSISEMAAEAVVVTSEEDAHADLVQYRVGRRSKNMQAAAMDLGAVKVRGVISSQKIDFLNAAIRVINDLVDYWPVSIRTIHYQLLNDPPLRNSVRKTPYVNDRASYSDLSGLLTDARFAGLVPFDAIHDPTRPVTTWNVHGSPGDFIARQVALFLKGYYRDLLQSQPHHVEVVGEKSTLQPIVEPVCADYTVPLTIGRGYCSVPPRRAIYERFMRSGKDGLVLVVLSDHDPDGENIATSFARSMRDDLGVPASKITAIRAALTRQQVNDLKLPPSELPAKKESGGYADYVRKYGTAVYELEAIRPVQLERLLRDAIESVLDVDAFKEEQRRERADAREIDAERQKAMAAMRRG